MSSFDCKLFLYGASCDIFKFLLDATFEMRDIHQRITPSRSISSDDSFGKSSRLIRSIVKEPATASASRNVLKNNADGTPLTAISISECRVQYFLASEPEPFWHDI